MTGNRIDETSPHELEKLNQLQNTFKKVRAHFTLNTKQGSSYSRATKLFLAKVQLQKFKICLGPLYNSHEIIYSPTNVLKYVI